MNKITKEKKNSKAGDRAAAGTKINSEFSLNKSSMVRTDIGDSDPEVRSNDLKELTAQWMQLERKTMEQRKNAAKFYDDYLMKPIEEEFIRNNQDMVFEEVEYMVVSVGTSYEPIVLDTNHSTFAAGSRERCISTSRAEQRQCQQQRHLQAP